DTDINIGDNVMIGPNVTLATGTHPIHPELRRKVAQFNLPVDIEENVWIGAGAIILHGVRIGENTVIGPRSVVTRDIPANVIAVGNPCRVMREINDHDMKHYYKDIKIEEEDLLLGSHRETSRQLLKMIYRPYPVVLHNRRVRCQYL